MRRFLTIFYIILIFYSVSAYAFDSTSHVRGNIIISTVNNRPLSLDKLLCVAFKNINYQMSVSAAPSLQQGYTLTNSGERDGVISSTPSMEQAYPNLIKVPVVLDTNHILVFTRVEDETKIDSWESLSGFKVGILSQRVYIQNQIPETAVITSKETTKLAMDGLLDFEYDAVVLSIRGHEDFTPPEGIERAGELEVLPEYLFMHKDHEDLIPEITESLNNMLAENQVDHILEDSPLYAEYLGITKRTILHIISSASDISTEERLISTLRNSILFRDDMSIDWYTVSLNTKRFYGDEDRMTYFAGLLRKECLTRNINAILVSGEDALAFLNEYYQLFFRNVPVLYYGISEDTAADLDTNFTGIVESLSAYGTATLALSLFPGTSKIYILNDQSREGIRYDAEIRKQLEPLRNMINIEYIPEMSFSSLIEYISSLPADSILIAGSFFLDADRWYYSLNEVSRALEINCSIPIFSMYSSDVVYNSIGGKTIDYGKYGEILANRLKNLLDGVPVDSIPVVSDPGEYSCWVFSKAKIDFFNISERSLPAGSLILGKEPPVWETNPAFAYGSISLIMLGVVIAAFYGIYSHARTKSRKANEFQQRQYVDELQRNEKELKRLLIAAEKATKSKTVFLANMSHEIRTPINSILGFSSLALDDNIQPKTKDYLEKIISSSEGLLMIINDILDISKIEADKLILENIPFDMHDIFTACSNAVLPNALKKGITLYCYAEPSFDKMILGDPTRLKQALLNLLANAVKFTNSGIVKLFAAIKNSTEESITMYFEVKDSGIGMTQEQIENIFEPFAQADDSTTRVYGGTGLGLPITKKILESMGGRLNVESSPGIGSKFSFILTFKTISVPIDKRAQVVDMKNIERPMFNGTILVCEDNALNRQVICEHLDRVGLKTCIAVNGKECVDIVKNKMTGGNPEFDLIFMDIHMPVMDGLEASKKLNEMGVKTPIVALTANIMTNDRETYQAHGIPDFLGKPFTTKELWHCLLRYLKPVNMIKESKSADAASDKHLNERIISGFLKDNKNVYFEINDAITRYDTSTAHLKAHNLKGVAGLLGQNALREAAEAVEKILAGKNLPSASAMANLERELNFAFSELERIQAENQRVNAKVKDENTKSDPSPSEMLALIEKLEPLLIDNSFDCMDFIDELTAVAETKQTAEFIERFEFKAALQSLSDVRIKLKNRAANP